MKIGYAKTLTGKLDSVTQETFIDQYAVEKFYVDKISSTSLMLQDSKICSNL